MVASILLTLLMMTQSGCGQGNANDNNIVYLLPAKTTAAVTRLLAGRTPTYVSFNRRTEDTILLIFSFNKSSETVPERQNLMRIGNRVLKINKEIYPVVFDYDSYFYPKKNYLDGGGVFNSIHVYVNRRGEFLKSANWTLDKDSK